MCRSIWYGLNVFFFKGHNWISKSTGEIVQIPDVMWGMDKPKGGDRVILGNGILQDVRNGVDAFRATCEITRKEMVNGCWIDIASVNW